MVKLKLMCLEILAFQNQHFVVGLGMNKNGKKRKKARTASDPGPDKAVYSWLVKERQAGTPISGLVM